MASPLTNQSMDLVILPLANQPTAHLVGPTLYQELALEGRVLWMWDVTRVGLGVEVRRRCMSRGRHPISALHILSLQKQESCAKT